MMTTKRRVFCRKIEEEFPSFYAHCRVLGNNNFYFDSSEITRYITNTEIMIYIISKEVRYPHTPDSSTFFNKGKKKQKKYVGKLEKYINENPEVIEFAML